MLLLFFAIVLVTVNIDPNLDLAFGDYRLNKDTLALIGMTTLKVSIVLVAGIVLVSTRQSRRVVTRAIYGLPRLFFFTDDAFREKVKERICVRLAGAVDNFAVGLDMLKSPKKVCQCLILSFLAWVFAGASHYLLTFGSPGIEVTFLEMCAVMVILCFFISLPSAPGFWGLWEAGGVFGLLIFGVPAKEAAGFTLANHVIQILPIIAVGIVSSFVTGVSLLQVTHDQDG
jgi:uncharacterized protein (TIRG00374 family)